ncbi:MAG: histidinol-phosphatase [Pseudomonadota bacterium]|nr:histidinol-phosphatase [Pseudomonadota bacterium]MDE3037182.1 histidinol-phosphatase [Pseudomonadota bacterium]
MDEFLSLAGRLADSAGGISRRHWRAALPVDAKADTSPVTEADREAEAAMRSLIEEIFPDHGIIGEEFGNVRRESPYQWVLDPIDGTRAFIAGYPTFATLIALAKDSIPILGIVDQPVTQERWIGMAGKPAMFRHPREGGGPVSIPLDARLHGNDKTLSQAVIATTSMPYHFNAAEAAVFEKIRKQCAQTVIGGDGYGYAMVASGHIDIFIDSGLKPYDFCALRPIIEGAGGVITDWKGQKLTLHSDGRVVAAGNKKLHLEALTFLQPAI